MIQELVGERGFQKALIEYLNKYQYSNAKGSQLWKIVEKVGEISSIFAKMKNSASQSARWVEHPETYRCLHLATGIPGASCIATYDVGSSRA